jgi:hypothetical protein
LPRLPRRSFLGRLLALLGALGIGRRAAAQPGLVSRPTDGAQDASLDLALVTALSHVMLPSELGPDGQARASRSFTQWVAGYRAGAEILHPYGSGTIRYAGPSPAARWRPQLAALDREARRRHGRGFTALTRDQRQSLVRSAIEGERLDRMPEPLAAPHVAVALASWFLSTPEATDLCYRARIARQQCRPLVNAAREPAPLPSRPGAADGAPMRAEDGAT